VVPFAPANKEGGIGGESAREDGLNGNKGVRAFPGSREMGKKKTIYDHKTAENRKKKIVKKLLC